VTVRQDALLATWTRGVAAGPPERPAILLAAVTGWTDDDAVLADVGTRDALLLAALMEYSGAVARTVVRCASCGGLVEVPLDLGRLPRSPLRDRGEVLVAAHGDGVVRFRLPTTEDLLAVRTLDATAAHADLLSRCLVENTDGIPAELADAVEAAMAQACPGVVVEVRVSCSGCAGTTDAALDVAGLLWTEIELRAVALLQDVHALASAYGWTQADVLALDPVVRATYLELVDR
jgi:hypothetical protein